MKLLERFFKRIKRLAHQEKSLTEVEVLSHHHKVSPEFKRKMQELANKQKEYYDFCDDNGFEYEKGRTAWKREKKLRELL